MSPEASKTCLFIPFDLPSHYVKCNQLAASIANSYNIVFRSSANTQCNQLINAQGHQIVDGKRLNAAQVVAQLNSFDHSWLKKGNIEPVFLDLVRLIEEVQPSVVINDCCLPVRMACEYTNTQCYSIVLGHMCRYSAYKNSAPARHPAVKFLRLLSIPENIIGCLSNIVQPIVLKRIVKDINSLRRSYGLLPTASYLEELEGEMNLITDDPQVVPMQGLPDNFHYIGPIFNNNQDDEADLLACLDRSKQTIFVCTGTSVATEASGILDMLGSEMFDDYNVIYVGQATVPSGNILSRAYVNLNKVLPQCDLAIIHGGDATIYQCLNASVAILGIPAHSEQCWGLQRVYRLGMGQDLPKGVSIETLANLISTWLSKRTSDSECFARFKDKIRPDDTIAAFKSLLQDL